ncbi:MAG: hypothetical protein QW429_03375, partial [Thermoprotei archaeon]
MNGLFDKQRLGISRIALTSIVVVLIIIAFVVVGVTLSGFKLFTATTTTTVTATSTATTTVTATNSLTTTSENTLTSITTHSSTTSTQKSPLSIVVTQAILDTVESISGTVYYIYNVNVTNISPHGSYLVSDLFFQLTTSSNAVSASAFVFAMQNPLQTVTLGPGQHDYGQIAFEVATNDKP